MKVVGGSIGGEALYKYVLLRKTMMAPQKDRTQTTLSEALRKPGPSGIPALSEGGASGLEHSEGESGKPIEPKRLRVRGCLNSSL